MKTVISRNLFAQVNSDSGSMTSLSAAVHKFSEPGEFYGTVLKGHDVVGQFAITVCESEDVKTSPARASQRSPSPGQEHQSRPQPAQVNIDLRELHISAPHNLEDHEEASSRFTVSEGGYAVFHVSAGSEGYAVLVHEAVESGAGPKVFDSRELRGDDLLSVRVFRPGTYSLVNSLTRAKAKLTVAYPEKLPKTLVPVRVECGKSKFSPEIMKIQPTQGLIFSFRAPSRIKIELVEPEDRLPRRDKRGAKARPEAPPVQTSTAAAERAGKRMVRRRLSIMPHRAAPY